MKVVIVVQARTGSTRLPGKVLMPAAGATLLQRMLERVRSAVTADEVVVATTELAADDAIAGLAHRLDLPCVRGHATDLLDRHLLAARLHEADVVVKIPSDCPLIDPVTIDRVIGAYLGSDRAHYVSNLHPASWPDGFDVEVMSYAALETAGREAERPLDREHTTPYLWDNPHRFVVENVTWGRGWDASKTYRLTLDHREDYEVIRALYDELWSPIRHFTLDDILDALAGRPELAATNAQHLGASWMDGHRSELRTNTGGLR
jgi:spore coat polysaccharide biosynthesis protein SpsF